MLLFLHNVNKTIDLDSCCPMDQCHVYVFFWQTLGSVGEFTGRSTLRVAVV